MSVELSIGRLAFDGVDFSPREARAARHAVEAELTRLLGGGELPPRLARGGAVGRLSRRPLQVGAWADPGDLGVQVARALYTGLGGGTPWAS
jgi:hypothetical protein